MSLNKIDERPWGEFEVLVDEDYTKVKRITVKPNEQLSYQYHHNRNEVWTNVGGVGEVVINDINYNFEYGHVITIFKEQKHRVKNVGDSDLIFIETQYGDSFDEDDIIRLEDKYNRK